MHSDSKISSNEYKIIHLLAAVAPSEAISSLLPSQSCCLQAVSHFGQKGLCGKDLLFKCFNYPQLF